jgi:carbonic anhydrase/acetyltransferase-like protein (isoleucine patch superfamily)
MSEKRVVGQQVRHCAAAAGMREPGGARYISAMQSKFLHLPGDYYAAPSSTVVGDVTIGELCSFWFGAVVRGDVAPVVLGKRVNVQDNVVMHCDTDLPNIIEDDVTIGHSAIVHGQFVGRGSLIGMGAKVLGETRIGEECLIGAGALVPPGMVVPDRMVVMGVPGKIVRPIKDEELKYMKWLTTRYIELAQKYATEGFVSHVSAAR